MSRNSVDDPDARLALDRYVGLLIGMDSRDLRRRHGLDPSASRRPVP